MSRDFNPGNHILLPSDMMTNSVNLINERANTEGGGIPFFIDGLASYLKPMLAGELVVVMGRPSNYKSGVMQYVGRKTAEYFKALNDERDEALMVFYCSWEQSAEDMGIFHIAASAGLDASLLAQGDMQDETKLKSAATDLAVTPMSTVGWSMLNRRGKVRLTVAETYDVIRYAEKKLQFGGKKIRAGLVLMDYLQRIKPSPNSPKDRRIQMMDAVDDVAAVGKALTVPLMLGIQAGRQVDYRENKLPSLADGQECIAGCTVIADAHTGTEHTVEEWYDMGIMPKLWTLHDYVGQDKFFTATSPTLFMKKGKRPVVKIETISGYTLICTPDHEVFTPGGWRWAAGLTDEDHVGVHLDWIDKGVVPESDQFGFTRVFKIENAGEMDVFDFTVPVTHNYVGGGFVVHNCSNIEQSADRAISVVLPKMYYPTGMVLDTQVGYPPVMVTNHTMLLKPIKQKFGETGRTFPIEVDLTRNEIKGVINV